MIIDRIGLHTVLLPLFIDTIFVPLDNAVPGFAI